MPLTVEISSLPIIHNNFYFQQLIDLYPGRTFMLMNDALPDLSFKKNESYNSDEIKKLGLKLFGPKSDTDNVDPGNLHLTYDSTYLYEKDDPQYILIDSEEQKIKFVDPGIKNKFFDNYPAYSIFKAISTPRPDRKFNEIKGVYHVKSIDYRFYKDHLYKYTIAHDMFKGTIIDYMVILYDFISNSEANTLFLIQTPSYTNGSYAINYYKIIFFIIYEQLKIKIDSGQLRDINIEKKLIFRIYGFKSIPRFDELVHTPPGWYNEEDSRQFNDLLSTIDIRAFIEFEITTMLDTLRRDLLGKTRKLLKRSSSRNSSKESSDNGDSADNGESSDNDESVGNGDSADNNDDSDDNDESDDNNDVDNQSVIIETNENTQPLEGSSEENLLDDFYQHMEDWIGDNMMKILFKTEPPEIVELEHFVSKILGKKNAGEKMTNIEKLKKIFEKFRSGEINPTEESEEKEEGEEKKDGEEKEESAISGGSLRTLEDFKDYIKQKIKEIVPKTFQ